MLFSVFKWPFCPTRLEVQHPSYCAALCETISRSAWTGWWTCTRNTSMAFWQTKRAWAKLFRLWLTWPTWLARKVSLFLNNTHSVWMFAVILFPSFFSGYKDVVYVLLLGVWGPHLIVVRTCKLLNWEVEFKRWCPGLKILLYFGNRRERRSLRAVGLLLHFSPLFFLMYLLFFDAPIRLQKTDCKFANIMDSFIRSGGEEPTASMCAWRPTSCWWKTRAISWGDGGGI